MTDKKVFKNVVCVMGSRAERKVYLFDDELEGAEDPFTYNPSEWDLEVTLTRKVKEIKVGDVVTDGYFKMTVLAMRSDRLWCYNFARLDGGIEDFYSTELAEHVEHVS